MMRRAGALALSVVQDALRRKVVYIIIAFAALMAIAIPSLPSYGLGVEASVYREVALSLTYVVSVVTVLALAANRVPGEVERRTVFNVLSKPVARWEYLVGLWLGVCAVMAGTVAAFTVVLQVIAAVQYGAPMFVLWEASFGIWLEVCVLAAFSVLVSTRGGAVVVVTAALAFLFITHSRASLLGEEVTGITRALYPSLDNLNVVMPVSHGDGIDLAYAAGMLALAVGWAGALLAGATALFTRRDL